MSFCQQNPYLLGQIGLVGNFSSQLMSSKSMTLIHPYLLGQIGLVGNVPFRTACVKLPSATPYLLGQIGLVGNSLETVYFDI
ncbi:MAG: hypothetical protein RLZZ580_1313 [Cyanobacteriota bacterium]|jgi:hypothetical protein